MILKGIVRLVWDDSHNSKRSSGHFGVFHFASPTLSPCQATPYPAPKCLPALGKQRARTSSRNMKQEGAAMKVKFTLTMDDLTVDDDHYDSVVIDWISEVQQEEVLEMSQRWITSQNFLTRRMIGLQRVGESSLTIEPIDENITT
jgi:hypothetical protein